jgi:short-subunit dehydrogenase
MKEIKNRNALITGGARGMGRLWAERFLADGASVILWDLDASALKTAAKELVIQYPGKVRTVRLDITDRKAVYREAKKAGRVDILVNNAGIVAGGPLLETIDEKLAATIDVNLTSTIWMIKAFLPGMITRECGHIINISSAAGMIGTPFMAAYNASKWGLLGLTESIKLEMDELKVRGINFTVVCPSYVDTGMFHGAKAPLLIPLLKPEKLVHAAYRAFRKNRYYVMAPFMVNFIPFLRGIMPNAAFNFIAKILGVTRSMSGWKGRGK